MNPSARITVTTGPDRGSLLEITEESVQIGRAGESTLVLNDPLLEDQQINITRRGGRHAIFVSGTDKIEVDATRIPPDRWVWLPQSASIQVTRRTTLEFISLLTVSDADYDAPAADHAATGRGGSGTRTHAAASASDPEAPAASKRPSSGKGDTKTGMRIKPAAARFITDQAGDPLVKLGADGHLPDLALQEGTTVVPQKAQPDQKSSSVTLIVGFAVSVGMSLVMLFLELEGPSGTVQQAQVARKAIKIYYGTEIAPIEPYQRLLRRANWAYSQGDTTTERQLYREVLRMLRAENQNSVAGLTRLLDDASKKFDQLTNDELKALNGPTDQFQDLKNDDRLERLLSIILRGS